MPSASPQRAAARRETTTRSTTHYTCVGCGQYVEAETSHYASWQGILLALRERHRKVSPDCALDPSDDHEEVQRG